MDTQKTEQKSVAVDPAKLKQLNLAVEALEATEEGAFLNEEQFTSIEERL